MSLLAGVCRILVWRWMPTLEPTTISRPRRRTARATGIAWRTKRHDLSITTNDACRHSTNTSGGRHDE